MDNCTIYILAIVQTENFITINKNSLYKNVTKFRPKKNAGSYEADGHCSGRN